jgi:hypothetical protein
MNSLYDFVTHVKGIEYIVSVLFIAGRVFRTTALMLFHWSLVGGSAVREVNSRVVAGSLNQRPFPQHARRVQRVKEGTSATPRRSPHSPQSLLCCCFPGLARIYRRESSSRDRNQSQLRQTADLLPRLSPMREFVRQSVLSARFAEALSSMFVRGQGLARRGVRERMSRNDRTIR